MWSRPEVKEHLTYALDFAPKVFKYFEEDYYKSSSHCARWVSNVRALDDIKSVRVENCCLFFSTTRVTDMAALPGFAGRAMENWGLISYRENYLAYDEKMMTLQHKERMAALIAHELAHQVQKMFECEISVYSAVVRQSRDDGLVGRLVAERRLRFLYGVCWCG